MQPFPSLRIRVALGALALAFLAHAQQAERPATHGISIANLGSRTRNIQVTSYAEMKSSSPGCIIALNTGGSGVTHDVSSSDWSVRSGFRSHAGAQVHLSSPSMFAPSR